MGRFKLRQRAKLHRDDIRVAVLTPCDDTVKTEYAQSLVEMLLHTFTQPVPQLSGLQVMPFGSTILPFSRQMLAKYALDVNATHTLWIDSDMKFPKDMLLRFIRHDKPVVGINAMSRRAPYRNCAQVSPSEPMRTTRESVGLEKAYRMGFGIMWVATEVFRRMEPPYFDFQYMPDVQVWRGEDYVFFEKARGLGYEFLVDHDLSKEVFHVGSFGYNPMMMEQMSPQPAAPA